MTLIDEQHVAEPGLLVLEITGWTVVSMKSDWVTVF